ncbi:MAG TPA: DUF3052 family protein [Actinomycetota bacterium]|nr:DUF3052 family protein [Actinomycetota bacterium]
MTRVTKDDSGTPLWKKLGIRPGAEAAFVGSPPGFREALGPLPAGVRVHSRPRGELDVVVFFTSQRSDLLRRLPGLKSQLTPAGGLWVAWPKNTSGIQSDLSFEDVQRTGLDAGLVDNKSCSIDADWQALRFVYRLVDRTSGAG